MEDIIKKIQKNKKTNIKSDSVFNQIELEITYKIEREKTRQLELIRDIRKIEKSIKEKELYNKRKNIYSFNKSSTNNKHYNNSDSEMCSDIETDIESNSESDSESDSDLDSEKNSDIDSISMYSDSSNISYKEIEIL